ncbi:ETS1 [Mytilus edulis]|uniref:ETS1 n=1 Tax=Mytilus edulis TaxID=6550 RepID=A0A8S3R483_MYTED|nr:ETS1 [Mytilus edulis]
MFLQEFGSDIMSWPFMTLLNFDEDICNLQKFLELERKRDIPVTTQVLPLTPGTSQKMSQALLDSFKSFEKVQYDFAKDPALWTESHITKWLQWAIQEFHLENINMNNFRMNGQTLVKMAKKISLRWLPHLWEIFYGNIWICCRKRQPRRGHH